MLRTNLSTKPFYNIRAVQLALGGLALLVAIMTVVSLVQLVRLNASERSLGARASQAEAEAARMREETARIRSQIDTRQLAQVAAAASEAQAIIDLRTFSWSALFTQLEETLPQNVRFTNFRPRVDRDGRFKVSVRAQARRVQDLESFLDALEATGSFSEVLATDEQTSPEGLIDALVEGVYMPPAAEPRTAGTTTPAPAEEGRGE